MKPAAQQGNRLCTRFGATEKPRIASSMTGVVVHRIFRLPGIRSEAIVNACLHSAKLLVRDAFELASPTPITMFFKHLQARRSVCPAAAPRQTCPIL